MNKTNSFPHIKFGFRGEGIIYNLGGNEYEIWSSWVDGTRIYLDDLRKTNLDEIQKSKILDEIIQFTTLANDTKPIVCFNSDYLDAELWKSLTVKFESRIKSTEITNLEIENEKLYTLSKKDLETGRFTSVYPNGLVVKSVKYLDKHWDYIKYRKDDELEPIISFWQKLMARLNL